MIHLRDIFYLANREDIDTFLKSIEHPNRSACGTTQGMWVRFQNFDGENLPIVCAVDGKIKAIAFIVKLKTKNMINLYDIYSFEKGYGRKLWDFFIEYYYNKGVRNIKFRALFGALKFYEDLGIYYWGFDGTSFTVCQPLFPTPEQMREWLEEFKLDPYCPDNKLLVDVPPSKKNQEKIEKYKIELGDRYYLNVKDKRQKGEDW